MWTPSLSAPRLNIPPQQNDNGDIVDEIDFPSSSPPSSSPIISNYFPTSSPICSSSSPSTSPPRYEDNKIHLSDDEVTHRFCDSAVLIVYQVLETDKVSPAFPVEDMNLHYETSDQVCRFSQYTFLTYQSNVCRRSRSPTFRAL